MVLVDVFYIPRIGAKRRFFYDPSDFSSVLAVLAMDSLRASEVFILYNLGTCFASICDDEFAHEFSSVLLHGL